MPAKVDLDPSKGVITITPNGSSAPIVIENVSIDRYRKILYAPHSFFCYKDPRFDPHTFSCAAGRYSLSGKGCLYTAESIAAAQKEVSNFSDRDLFQVSTTDPIFYLDFVEMAKDFGITDLMTLHLSAGGWEPTQQIADYFTSQIGLTAINVPSTKVDGGCMNFYADDRMPPGFLAPFKLSTTGTPMPES